MNGLAVDHVAKGILRLDSCLMTGLCLRMVVELAGTFAAELLGVRDNLRPEQEGYRADGGKQMLHGNGGKEIWTMVHCISSLQVSSSEHGLNGDDDLELLLVHLVEPSTNLGDRFRKRQT